MELINEIAQKIRDKYVLAEKADSIADAFLANSSKLDSDLEPNQLAAQLTKLLHEASNDKHFLLRNLSGQKNQAPQLIAPQETMRRNNYFFHSAKRLAGNVGYLDLRLFPFDNEAAHVAIGAMAFLANSDAIIFDLRKNKGGHPAMIQLLLTYLFDEPQHINSFYYRPTAFETQMWTLPWLPGKRLADVPVYVLTSGQSASAAEEFAYDIQQMKRGLLVGETSAGAAHPVEPELLSGGFLLHLPTGRPINPISKANWEGVGVVPDLDVPQEKALEVAHLHAIETLLSKSEGQDADFWHWELEAAKADYAPIAGQNFAQFAGTYEVIEVVLENGRLHFISSRGKRPLKQLTETLFALDDAVRVQFSQNALTILYRDRPQTTTHPKQIHN